MPGPPHSRAKLLTTVLGSVPESSLVAVRMIVREGGNPEFPGGGGWESVRGSAPRREPGCGGHGLQGEFKDKGGSAVLILVTTGGGEGDAEQGS